ncbi:MAG TPA: GAF domain-containing protein, partial [Pyrinomonadaceae bacterium]|nr:GAF domain-containing protein [Pyrinomonadaceae bacterium]
MSQVPAELSTPVVTAIPEAEDIDLRLRLFDVFTEATTQMLATTKLHERLLLALEAIIAGFGYGQAAIAMMNERDGVLRIRAAQGFEDDAAARIEIPLDSSAACVRVVHEGRPIWISLKEDEQSALLFGKMDWKHDVLALPMFGVPEMSQKRETESSLKPRLDVRHWSLAPASCMGALYIGAQKEVLDSASLQFLARFADRIGIVASSAIQQERLIATVNKLQRERQWVESIMKSVADPIVLTDLDNQILLQNRRAEE